MSEFGEEENVKRLIFLGLISLLALAGCGGGDGSSPSSNGTPVTPPAPTATTVTIAQLTWPLVDSPTKTSWGDAVSFCDALDLDGNTDWRLPSVYELITLNNYSSSTPSFDQTVFQYMNNDDYWTATSEPGRSTYAYYIDFYLGYLYTEDKVTGVKYAKCVRGATSSFGPYTDNGQTIIDQATGLMWTKYDTVLQVNLYEAAGIQDATYNPTGINECGGISVGGYNDWRLPTVRELLTIVRYSSHDPSINTALFPDAASGGIGKHYWTRSESYYYFTDPSDRNYWYVRFTNGTVRHENKSIDNKYVRCVR